MKKATVYLAAMLRALFLSAPIAFAGGSAAVSAGIFKAGDVVEMVLWASMRPTCSSLPIWL